ncbi:DUF6612 family protein [Bacillus sp. B15-48]|uniref:DUF6612 family protein n=1 Tax=Bacillus sp. B15-48 TaxID=1548601 RepID=UPI0019401E1D|nr:DUF6612 family protein [Bacillus sp. B15-48]MBM4761802.1 hypothetical protein [Bacillus sp. B15-48]
MKKKISIMSGFLLVFLLLAACNGNSEQVDQDQVDAGPVEQAETDENETASDQLTIEQVFEKSAQASEQLLSFAMNMDLVQEVTSEETEENMEIHSSIHMEVVSDPIAFYQKMSMELAGESVNTESYFSQDGFYMQDPVGGTWMKLPTEMTNQMIQLSDQQTNPAVEIERLQKFSEDFTFEENEHEYLLLLTASGEQFNELIQETIEQTLPVEFADDMDAMEDLKIHTVKYKIAIDKETFFPRTIEMNMDMEIIVEDQTIQLTQYITGEYSKYNEFDEITIPQEIIDSATEIDFNIQN